VSILLTEKLLFFIYYIIVKYMCFIKPNRLYVEIYVLDDLSSFNYVEI